MANIWDEWEEPVQTGNIWDQWDETTPKGGLMEFPKGMATSFVGAGKRMLETLQKVEVAGAEMPGSWMPSREAFAAVGAPLPEPGTHLEEPIQRMIAAEEKLAPIPGGPVAKIARFAGEAGGTMAQIIAAGATGGAPLIAAFMGTQGYQSAYDKAKAAGASETKANIEGVLNGAVDAALSVYGADKLLSFRQTGKASMGAFVRNLRGRLWQEAKGDVKNITLDTLKGATAGALSMAGFAGAGLAVPAAVSQRWPKKEDGSPDWGQILTEIGGAAIGGAVMGGGTTLLSTIPRGLHEVAMPTQPEILKAARQVQAEAKLTPFEKARSLDELKGMMPKVGVVQTAKSSPVAKDPFAVPENVQQTMAVVDRIQQDVAPLFTRKAIKTRKGEISEALGEKFAGRPEKVAELRAQGKSPEEVTALLLYSEKGQLKKQLPEFKTPYTTEDINKLQWAVQEANIDEGTRSTLFKTLKALFKDNVPPASSEIKTFDKFFGTNIMTAAQGRPEGTLAKVADICNAYKAVRASFDHSMVLRQGIVLFVNHPLKGTIAAGKGLRAMWSEDYYRMADLNMRTNPYWKQAVESGLSHTEVGRWSKSEEQFGSQTAHKLPWVGKIVRGSDRAATTYLNGLRFDCFQQVCRGWEGLNKSPVAYKQLAEYIGHATGRGGWPKKPEMFFEKYNELFQAGFWAPRMTVGRVQTLTDLLPAKLGGKPEIRKMIAGDLLAFFGTGTMALGLASLIPGVKVEVNPQSSDFGKGRVGNIRFDFWGGYSQIIRTIAQFITAKKKTTTSEEIYNISRRTPIIQFLRSKLSPQAQIGWDVATGKTFTGKIARWGEPDFLTRYMAEQIPPLIVTDIIDAIKNNGFIAATAIAPASFFGVGTQVYDDTSSGTERQVKNSYAHEIFGCDWQDLGPAAQDELKRNRPLIQIWQDKAKRERENLDFVALINQEAHETGRRILRSLPNKTQKEFERLQIDIGDIQRYIGGDWRLNQKRYGEYEKILRETLNKVLTETISQPGWTEVDSADQKLYLEQMIKDIKTYIRGETVTKANYEDLEKVQR